MRKITFLLFAIFSLLLCTSCTKDEVEMENKLEGTWYYESHPERGYEFYADHTGISFDEGARWDIRWILNDGILSIEYNDSDLSSLNKDGEIIFLDDGQFYWRGITFVSDPRDCYTGSGSGFGNGGTGGYGSAPSSLVSKTLNLYKDDNSYWIGIYHMDGSQCMVDLYNDAMLSYSYPPTYSYSRSGSSASYNLTFTTETYIPFYGTSTYAQFVEKLSLKFSDSSSGTFSGTQTNMNGDSKKVSGKFRIE